MNAALDPYSLRQHRRLRDVLRQVRDYDVPVEREAFQVLAPRTGFAFGLQRAHPC